MARPLKRSQMISFRMEQELADWLRETADVVGETQTGLVELALGELRRVGYLATLHNKANARRERNGESDER